MSRSSGDCSERCSAVAAARPVLRQVEQVLVDVVREELTEMSGAHAGRIPVDAMARYTVGAYLGLMDWWLTSQPEMSPEEADRIFHALVAPGLRTATRTPST